MVSTRRIKVVAIGAGLCLLLSLLSLVLLFFYYLSFICHWYGSVLLFFVMFWLLLRLAVKILVFPGSCWFWKRSIEASFCVEMTNQVYYKVRDLRQYLQSIQNQERFALQSNSPVLIESLTDRLKGVRNNNKLSKLQEDLLRNLEDMKKLMQETMVIVDSQHSRSIWDWIQERANRGEPSDIVYEDYPDCLQAKKLIKLCTELEEGLLKSCGTAKFTQKLKRWLVDDTLGSIHYLREDLLKRFQCEQLWIQSDTSKIDW